jgi:predicted transcriptional regulator
MGLVELRNLVKEWRKGPSGPLPKIDLVKLISAIIIISWYKPIGRYLLSKLTDVPQGVVRGLLNRLQSSKHVVISKRGALLTPLGEKTLNEVLDDLKIDKIIKLNVEEIKPLTEGKCVIGICIKKAANNIRSGVEQRDEAIKHGAKGATTIVCKSGDLYVPPTYESLRQLSPNIYELLMIRFNPKDDDVIIISWNEKEGRVLEGVISAVISTLGLGS